MARRGKMQFGCKGKSDIIISNASTGTGVAETMSGFDINGTMAFCVKRSETENKSAVYRINSYETASKPADVKIIPIKSYGMTYFAQNLYIAADNNKVARVPIIEGDTTTELFDVVSLDGTALKSQAIANVSGSKFILMANALNETDNYFCFSECTLNATSKKFEETRRFYVKSSGYSIVKDIYYDTKHGLFIATNKPVSGGVENSSLILHVAMNRVETNGYKGRDLYYPTAQYYLVGSTDSYSTYTIESIAMASVGNEIGKMYAVARVKTKTGENKDRMLHFTNFAFYQDKPLTVTVSGGSSVDIPNPSGVFNNKEYVCENAGAMALNGENVYCLVSDTKGDHKEVASVLLKTTNADSGPFAKIAPENTVYTNMGHGNGMTYYNGALYVAAYRRDIKSAIVKLSTTGEQLAEYIMDAGSCIGSISHYKDNLFVLGEYNGSNGHKYAYEPKFYIGYFENNRFVKTKTFSVTNPTYDIQAEMGGEGISNVLQDIYYDSEFGLYYITRTNEIDHMYRVTAEQIEQAGSTALEPVEQYEFDDPTYEPESLAISALAGTVGTMYIVCNGDEESNVSDKMYKVNGFKFYR